MMLLYTVLLLAGSFYPAAGQNDTGTVWGVVTVNNYGDRVPMVSTQYSVLTALGANQMYEAGKALKERYLAPSAQNISQNGNYTIAGISSDDVLDNTQTFVYSLYEIFIDQSTQAFMAGLYPPSGSVSTITGLSTPYSQTLANGDIEYWPNSGAQYPQMMFVTDADPNSTYLQGMDYCPALSTSLANWQASSDFRTMNSSTQSFYQALANDMSGAGQQYYELGYSSAYGIWDWISFQQIHNSSVNISSDTVMQARHLADSYLYSAYGNISADNGIRVTGGRTLAALILDSMIAGNKLTNIFTSHEPIISLFALMGLDGYGDIFRTMPNMGSTLAFELYTNSSIQIPSDPDYFPDVSSLSVRFLFHNGSSVTSNISDAGLSTYPIFDYYNEEVSMSLAFFVEAMESILLDIGTWCELCASTAVWCPSFTGAAKIPTATASSSSHTVSPVVAGVIGALVALVVAAILFLLAMLLFGIRFRREKKKRRSELGGFKGSEKLASDPDLPSKRSGVTDNGVVIGASVVPGVSDGAGHRRVESWELKEGRGTVDRRPSFETDPDGHMKSVEATESV